MLDFICVGRDASNFFKGIFGRQSTSIPVRAYLLTPGLFKNKRPQLIPTKNLKILEPIVLGGGYIIVDDDWMLFTVTKEVQAVHSIFVEVSCFQNLTKKIFMFAEEVKDAGEISQLNLILGNAVQLSLIF